MVLEFEDTEGTPHSFRFRFWTNNQSRMYLLEGMLEVQARLCLYLCVSGARDYLLVIILNVEYVSHLDCSAILYSLSALIL